MENEFTGIARRDIAQSVGEKAAQIGDNALRRIGPAANGEATQFGEQGGRIGSRTSTSTSTSTTTDSGSGSAAAARGAAVVSFVGRHVHVGQLKRELSKKLAKSYRSPFFFLLFFFCALSYVKAQRTLAHTPLTAHTH